MTHATAFCRVPSKVTKVVQTVKPEIASFRKGPGCLSLAAVHGERAEPVTDMCHPTAMCWQVSVSTRPYLGLLMVRMKAGPSGYDW